MSETLTVDANNSGVGEARRHWKRGEFLQLAQTGFFAEEKNAELIRGDIYLLEPPGPFHSGTVNPVADMLREAFGSGFYVRTEQPLVTSDADSQPQPDVAVCRGSSADYATAGIAEYWIINLRETRLEVYRKPDTEAGLYRPRRLYAPGETVTPIEAPGAALSVTDLLGA